MTATGDAGDGPSPTGGGPEKPRPRWWRSALTWGERALWAGILVFIAIRLGPQIGALTGIGPALGSAPELRFVTLDGKEVGPGDMEGKVVIVNFWATWCPPCRLEIPSLQKVHEELGSQGVLVVGLSTDAGSLDEVRAFLEERGVTYPVGMASPQHRRAFGGVQALPTTFILDRDGIIQHRVFGFFAPPAMRAAVNRLLRDEGPAS
ncbi:MAG TPA: TlpA disulfide reductase family protein [Longimicrobiales bacterium]|nr:TlpA disulfide reductase family protein [Longimicrobiales bacterium]